MARRRGPLRKLTDTQIHRVLAWHARWQRFHQRHGTQRSLAQRLQVNAHLIHGCIARYRRLGAASLLPSPFQPGRGRPKRLQERHLRAVIAWHLRYQRFLARQGSAKALAQSLGVSERTIHACISGRGAYRRSSLVNATQGRAYPSSVVPRAPRNTGVRDEAEHRLRAVLLKRWRRVSR
jgi:DNA-binding transcriptional regulator YdaS (Cro superfamily)